MKLSHLFNNLPKRLAATALVIAAVALPVAASAADMVKFSATTGVANVTAGDTTYGPSVSAKYNEVVKVEVTYDNNEDPSSTKTTNNLHLKINVPTAAGASQTVTTKLSADNITTVNGSVKVNLDGQDAYLQYIPGTAEWKHANTQNGPLVVEQKISDSVVTDPNGINLGTENPCQAGAVAVSLGVVVPGVSVDKYVRESGTSAWATSITAKSNDTIQYEIAYKNTGNTTEKNVEFRDQLPKGITYVPGTTKLKNSNYPNGTAVTSDAVVTDGILTGDYAPGAAGYVLFDAKVADESQLACGNNQMRNIAYVQPTGMNYYYNTADVNVTKTCASTPTYSCDLFHVTVGENKTVTVDNFKTTASNGATFTNAVINWGDQSDDLTTNNVIGQTHQYTGTGPYTLTATAHFTVNGKDVSTSGNCTQTVSFTTATTTTTTPTELPNTGAGNVIGIFAGAIVAGTVAGRLFLSRKLAARR